MPLTSYLTSADRKLSALLEPWAMSGIELRRVSSQLICFVAESRNSNARHETSPAFDAFTVGLIVSKRRHMFLNLSLLDSLKLDPNSLLVV